jgi:hypothetical protein
MTTAETLEAVVTRSFRQMGLEPNALEVAQAAADAAPEFDRLCDEGPTPVVGVDRQDGRLVIVLRPGDR